MTRPSKSKAIERLTRARKEIPKLKNLSTFSPEFEKWRRNTEVAIENTFGKEDRHIEDFTNVHDSFSVVSSGTSDYEFQQRYEEDLESADSVLESMIEEIEEYWEDEDGAEVSSSPPRDERTDTNKVFVVHGRDHATRDTVARLIEKLGLKALILDEQADKGRTIIEKFEQEAKEVRFAVVLLTADDEGRLRGEEADLKPRARQNVIFELGYFAGAIGRKRVCALTKGDFEIPSDYDGVVYIPLDDFEGWKSKLVRELQAAGFDVDANRAL